MRGRKRSVCNRLFVELVYPINERAVPFLISLEVMPERAIDEYVDNVGKPDEDVKVETLQQKRQDILGAYALKPFERTIPILVELFLPI